MADAISIQFPEADRRALFAQIERARKELGKGLGQAIRFAGYSVALTLGKSTRVAKKKREAFEVKGRGVDKADWKARRKYLITSFRGGQPRPFERYGDSLNDPRIKKAREVKNYGLAKASWMWAVRSLGGGGPSFGGTSGKAREKAQRYIETRKQLSGDNPEIRITNKLNYIRSAIIGGMAGVDSAMGRAARYMMRVIDANVAKKLGAR
jgi:hypothetical protein